MPVREQGGAAAATAGHARAARRAGRAGFWVDRAILLIVALGPLAGVIAAITIARARGAIGGANLAIFVALWALTMFAVEAGFHRYFAHRSFRTGRALEALLVILGSMAFQGPAIWWAAVHRRHHRCADREGDPHSPHRSAPGLRGLVSGLWDAHIGWNFREFETIRDKSTWKHLVPDLLENRWLRAVNRFYFLWMGLGLVLPAALGALATGSPGGALTGFLWGGLVRIFAVSQGIYAVNSLCHAFGGRPFALQSHDRSTNSMLVGLVTLGAGLHHNHHVFPRSATTQIQPWEIDLAGWVLRGLARLGVVWDLRRPPAAARESASRRRGVQVRLSGAAIETAGKLAGLSQGGAFVESWAAGAACAIGSTVRLHGFVGLADLPPALELAAVVDYASWAGVGLRFVAPSPLLGDAIAKLRAGSPGADEPTFANQGAADSLEP